MQCDDVAHGGLCDVQVIDVNGAGGSRLVGLRDGALDVPDRWGPSLPRRAKHGLGVAIDVAERRGRGVGGEQGRSLIPFLLELNAVAGACLVAAGDEDHPFLRALGGGLIWREEFFVIGHCEGGDVLGGYF